MPKEVENSKFKIPEDGKPILIGKILKKNKFFMQQERKFELYPNGDLKYFNGIQQKGMMQLTKKSKVRKTGKIDFEIVLPEVGKTYKMIQLDAKKMPPKGEAYSCLIDDWVDAINFVIALLTTQPDK